MPRPDLTDSLTHTLNRLLPPALGEELRRNLRAGLRARLEQLDVVTREEFDTQAAVLVRTREKLEALERQVEELEKQVASSK